MKTRDERRRYLNQLNTQKPMSLPLQAKKSILVKIRNWMTLRRTAESTRRGIEKVQLVLHSSSNLQGSRIIDLSKWLAGIQDPERNRGVDVDKKTLAKDSPLLIYRSILRLAKEEVESWGGELVFVYLPWTPSFRSPYRKDILGIVREAGIKMIDPRPEFEAHKTPSNIFAIFGEGNNVGHYSPVGYKIIANKMFEFLKNENAIP